MATRLQRIIRERDLSSYDGLQKSQRAVLISRGLYPRPIRLSDRAKGWLESEIIVWQEARISRGRIGEAIKPQPDRSERRARP